MKLESQVVSLDLAKRLKELGVKQESYAYWQFVIDKWQLTTSADYAYLNSPSQAGWESYSAFTVAELLDLLPPWIIDERTNINPHPFCMLTLIETEKDLWTCKYLDHDDNYSLHSEYGCTEATSALAKMVIYLLENKLVQLPA